MDHGYPRSVSSYWKGVPSDMEGVLPWHNGGVYVFKDTQNWFFSHSSQSIGVFSSYPKSIMQWWGDELELTGYTALRYDFPGLREGRSKVGNKVHHQTIAGKPPTCR